LTLRFVGVDGILYSVPVVDSVEIAKALSFNYMFRGLSKEALQRLADSAKVKEYNGGDLLVRQFDSSTDVLVLIEGNAISRTFGGEVVARFGPGSVIGEVAFLDRQKRSANVASVGSSKAIVVNSDEIWDMMEGDPVVGYSILKNLSTVLCMRLRSMNEFADTAASLVSRDSGRR
jgi:CRP/FNR family transcriptional regulator, cyclic AMP receptor protein